MIDFFVTENCPEWWGRFETRVRAETLEAALFYLRVVRNPELRIVKFSCGKVRQESIGTTALYVDYIRKEV